jgi:hypothetical protein
MRPGVIVCGEPWFFLGSDNLSHVSPRDDLKSMIGRSRVGLRVDEEATERSVKAKKIVGGTHDLDPHPLMLV